MNLLRKLFLVLMVTSAFTTGINAQLKTQSVGLELEKHNISTENAVEFLENTYGGNGVFTFEKIREYEDQYGMTHTDYQQKCNGIEMENCLVIVHSYGNQVVNMNGQVATADQVKVNQRATISANKAAQLSKAALAIKAKIAPNAEKMYTRCKDENGNETYRLVYGTRVTSFEDMKDQKVYVDVKTGEIVKKVNMILFAAAPIDTLVQTYYCGPQTLHLEKDENGVHYLRDTKKGNYTFEGKTTSKITEKEFREAAQSEDQAKFDKVLVDHIQSMIDNGKVKTAKDGNWDFLKMTYFQFDRFRQPDPDSANYKYGVKLWAGNEVLFTTSDWQKIDMPVEVKVKKDIQRDSTYKVQLYHIKYDENDVFDHYKDSVIYEFSFVASKPGVIEFPDTAKMVGSVTVERKGNHALDVHYTVDKCLDYYKEVHNRNSFDGKGSPVYQFVDLDDGGVFPNFTALGLNAFAWAAEPYFIATGIGDGWYLISDKFASFDLLSHEFNHLVTATNGRGGIASFGEAGAINEALADCFGVATDFWANPKTANWQIADSVMLDTPFMRDMSDPKLQNGAIRGYMTHPQANTYGGENWINPDDMNQDNGGVHFNNGVFNYWFYLLTDGGEGINDNGNSYKVEGIGIKKTEKILMDVVLNYLVREPMFRDMCVATRQSAKKLFGENSNEYKQLNNAWYAVGVSEKTDVESVEGLENMVVYAANGSVMVEAEEGATIEIYSTMGQMIESTVAQNGVTTIPMTDTQVVIVKVGNQAKKVLVK